MATGKEIHGIWEERLASGKASYEKLCQKVNRGKVYPSYLKVLALDLSLTVPTPESRLTKMTYHYILASWKREGVEY
jgi:hypothetical protein